MGYIYKITNLINNKVYIGQTRNTIQQRMYRHWFNAKTAKTGIDKALFKYGKDNFTVDTICECENEQLDELERFYVKQYGAYGPAGYNLTPGGQEGFILRFDSKDVVQKYQELGSVIKTADYYDCCEKTISNILHSQHIAIQHNNNVNNILGKGKPFQEGDNVKAVRIVELEMDFNSLKECAEWLLTKGYSKASSVDLARKSLSRALNGERQTYCGLHFVFI